MRIKIYGDSPHPDIAASYNNIGDVYKSQGDHSSALDCFQKCLNMQLKVYSHSPLPDIAWSYNNIGSVYQSQGDYSSALDCYQKSLNMQLKIHRDSPHPDIAMPYNNIGLVYRSQGDYSSALAWLRRGLAALPPSQSPHRTKISRVIHEAEQTVKKLVINMVRAHQLLTIQSQSHSPTMNHRLGLW